MESDKKISLVEIVIFMLADGFSDFLDILMPFIMLGGLGYSINLLLSWSIFALGYDVIVKILGGAGSGTLEQFFTGFTLFLFLPIANIFIKIALFFAKAFWLIVFKHEISSATTIILIGALLEIIPVINILPIGSLTLGIGIFMINHPKLTSIAEEAALAAATAGTSEVAVIAKEAATAAAKEAAKQKLQEKFA